jgi:hypothetical protein
MGNKRLDARRMGKPLSSLARILLRPSHSQTQDVLSTQEDPQAQFYRDYKTMADEYDKEFLKKHDQDLNTTLIFVSSSSSSDGPVLIRVPGRSILCSSRHVHNPVGLSASGRSQR